MQETTQSDKKVNETSHSAKSTNSNVSSRALVMPKKAKLAMECSSTMYALFWIGNISFHLVLAIYCLFGAGAHWLVRPDIIWWASRIEFLGLSIMTTPVYVCIWYFIFMALAHLYMIVRTLYLTCKLGRLAFEGGVKKRPTVLASQKSRLQSISKKLAFGERLSDFFSIDGEYFEVAFDIREVLEILSQTYQAYKVGNTIPRAWVSRLILVAVIGNCWSTPVIRWLLRRREQQVLQRFCCIMVDGALLFFTHVGLSLAVILPYILVLDRSNMVFPCELWYDRAWLNQINKDIGFNITNSWIGLAVEVIQSLSLMGCMISMRSLLRKRRTEQCQNAEYEPSANRALMPQTFFKPNRPNQNGRPIVVKVRPKSSTKRLRREVSEFIVSYTQTKLSRSIFAKFVHVGMLINGLFLLVQLGLTFKHTLHIQGCQAQVYPWFGRSNPCAVYIIDCQLKQIEGTAHQLDHALKDLHLDSLSGLTIAHCPQVVVPSRLQTFHNLLTLDFYNSTIDEWNSSSALTSTAHPHVVQLFLVRVNMSNGELPAGMLDKDFPPTLRNIQLSVTNLRVLPENLADIWPSTMVTFYVERSELWTIPSSFRKLRVRQLSFAGNKLTKLADDFFDTKRYLVAMFAFHENLNELPPSVQTLDVGAVAYFPYTNISSLPCEKQYCRTLLLKNVVNLYGTPICSNSLAQSVEVVEGLEKSKTCQKPGDIFIYHVLLEIYDDVKKVVKTL